MSNEKNIPVLPGDMLVVLDVCGHMHYACGVVRQISMENITRIFAKSENIAVSDMPKYANAQKWNEDRRAECESFFANAELPSRKNWHQKSIWIIVGFNRPVEKFRKNGANLSKTNKKRLYLGEILQLQKENRLTIIQPDQLK